MRNLVLGVLQEVETPMGARYLIKWGQLWRVPPAWWRKITPVLGDVRVFQCIDWLFVSLLENSCFFPCDDICEQFWFSCGPFHDVKANVLPNVFLFVSEVFQDPFAHTFVLFNSSRKLWITVSLLVFTFGEYSNAWTSIFEHSFLEFFLQFLQSQVDGNVHHLQPCLDLQEIVTDIQKTAQFYALILYGIWLILEEMR